MKAPTEYIGPECVGVPRGYLDVTTLFDKAGRRGIPGPDHPYYKTRDTIIGVIERELGFCRQAAEALADKIMDAI